MSSLPIRDAEKDNLSTPQNCTLVIIDYQPTQVNSINSMNRRQLVENIQITARAAKLYKLPIIVSTVNLASGINKDTIPSLKKWINDVPSYDRTSINAWEDKEFYEAIKATGRKKLIM